MLMPGYRMVTSKIIFAGSHCFLNQVYNLNNCLVCACYFFSAHQVPSGKTGFDKKRNKSFAMNEKARCPSVNMGTIE
jgi:hypothetical protein